MDYNFSKDLKSIREILGIDKKLLFHGAKSVIDGDIDVHHGINNNDFGQGFYTGESYEQLKLQ